MSRFVCGTFQRTRNKRDCFLGALTCRPVPGTRAGIQMKDTAVEHGPSQTEPSSKVRVISFRHSTQHRNAHRNEHRG